MLKALALAAGLTLASTPVLAHPHIFVDAKATVVFDGTGAVTGIRHAWTFDEAMSVWQIQGLDTDGNGMTTSEEMQELADENLIGLAEYGFYTFAGEGTETLPMHAVGSPRFVHENGLTALFFEVAFDEPYSIKNTLEIAINDPEYYVAITVADPTSVMLENAPAACAVTLEPPREMPDDVAAELYSLPPDVTTLPADLAAKLRSVQGAILLKCPPATGAVAEPDTALDAVTEVAETRPMPFGGPPAEPTIMPKTGIFGWLQQVQASFYLSLQSALANLKTDFNAFWVLGGLSFLYGVFHAAGPGHGKVVISSYMLANEQQVRRGIGLSFASALLQSLVAIGFVLIAAAALNLSATAMGEAANWIGIFSYGLVMLLGLWLIARKVFGRGHNHAPSTDMARKAHAHLNEGVLEKVQRPKSRLQSADAYGRLPDDPHFGHDHGPGEHHHGHDDHHDHDHDHHHHHVVTADAVRGDWREQLGVVLGVGLRPCSGALIVLVFALSQGLLAAGIVSVLLMGFGTAITVALLATLAVSAKGLAARLAGTRSGVAGAIVWWAELLGAVAVFGFGLLLLLASL